VSRYRLYPNAAQETALLEACGHARFVWNLGLEQRSMWRRGRGPTPGYNAQAAQLTQARAENAWLAAGSQTVQQQALRDLDRAFADFFAGTHRYPTWRKAGIHEGFRIVGAQALRVRQDNRRWSGVLVPKVGWVRFRRSRSLPDARSYRITRDRAGRWHIAFAAVPAPIPAPGTGEIVGVDRGVTVSAALSTGELLRAPGLRPAEAERFRRLQRRLARAQRGSNRRKALVVKIARLRAREADRRRDWAEKTSTDLARHYDLIVLEDLKTARMARSARGTLDAPGRNVRQKAGLNRGILASAWGLLARRLDDKAPGRVVKINPAFTSQRCSACGTVDREARASQAVYLCRCCGHAANADVNAARNIAAGHAVTGRGDMAALGRSVKRQPQLALTV
jgi:transposase